MKKTIEHHAVSWGALDIVSYMECMDKYDELPIDKLDEEFLLGIMEDVIEQYSDSIIEKINFYISEYLADNRQEIVEEIKTRLTDES